MRIIPNIKLTEQEVQNILAGKQNYGGESYICRSPKYNVLYKFFRNPTACGIALYEKANYVPDISELVPMSDNKLEKIKRLYQMQLEHSVQPLRTISLNGTLIGYEMTRDPDDRILRPGHVSRKDMIHFLNKSKEALQYFAQNDITYGDVNNRNLLINTITGEIKFCDIDNIRLGQFSIDIPDWELERYIQRGGADEHADAYMHSLMTLENFDYFFEELVAGEEELNREFKKKAIPIIDTLLEPQKYNGEYIIEYVKKRRG